MSLDLPFEVGSLYVRRELHSKYGGQGYGGISTPVKYPYIFLFAGSAGEKYGYFDRESESIYKFFGEGQYGDMQFKRGNKQIQEHVKNGKRLLLFKSKSHGKCEFIGEMELIGFHYETSPDLNKDNRKSIVFDLGYL